jgi:hypothetical protein
MKQAYLSLKFVISLVLSLICCTTLWAQHGNSSLTQDGLTKNSELVAEWPAGKVYLANGDSVKGKITYYPTEDLIKITTENGAVTNYAARVVRSFEPVGKDGKSISVFVTYKWNLGNDYSDFQAPAFFEQIAMGKYSLLRREAIVRKDLVDHPLHRALGTGSPLEVSIPRGVVYTDKRQDVFFILMPTGKVKQLRDVKRDLKVVFGKKNRQMRPYIMQNNLKYTSLLDMLKIITYFNTIS